MTRLCLEAPLVCFAAVAASAEGRAQFPPQGVHVADPQKVLATDGLAGDQFGSAAAMHGILAVVGAPLHDHAGLVDCGAAYVYRFDGTSWIEEAELVPSDAAGLDQFGVSVDVDNDTIVVGARMDTNQNGPRAGAAYVFTRSGTDWNQTAKLIASDGDPEDELGRSVAVWGDGILVGSHRDDEAGVDSGSVYVFSRAGTSWLQAQKIVAMDTAAGDTFGSSVALDGTTAAIGAPRKGALEGGVYVFEHDGIALVEQIGLTLPSDGAMFGASVVVSGDEILAGSTEPTLGSGKGLVLHRSGTSWALVTALWNPGLPLGDELGACVALDDGLALIGAPRHGLPAGYEAGASYLFLRHDETWSRVAELTAADAQAGDRYGSSLAMSGPRALVGARLDDDAGSNAGSAWFYRIVRVPSAFPETAKLDASDAAYRDQLGVSVALDGDTAIIGASLDDDVGSDSGTAHVFTRSGTSWNEQMRLVANDAAQGERFGISIALDSDTAVIGADDAGAGTGSAYVFIRTGTGWSQESKLVAPDGAQGDLFGSSVSVDGDRVLIGAPLDNTVGGGNAGSAYVFVRSGTQWSFESKLRAADGSVNDLFGTSVAISGDTAVVGAPYSTGAGFDTGSVYVFVRSSGGWSHATRLVAPDARPNDQFGVSAALDGDTLVVGALRAGLYTGSAYVLVRSGASWSPQAALVATDAQANDELGRSVALSADTIVVGAPRGDGDDGAAYVFERSGTSWTQKARLVASDGSAGDRFGAAAAVFGRTVLVGAPMDDGPPLSGSAYVFTFELAPSFCDAADGSHAACPCGNPGDSSSGCDTAQATGGVRLDAVAQTFVPQNRATLVGTGYPPASTPASIVIRGPLDPAMPVVFGDGLRCVGTPLTHLSVEPAVGGTSVHVIGHSAMGGTAYYQLWFRNQPAMFCTPDAFNLSNGRALAW